MDKRVIPTRITSQKTGNSYVFTDIKLGSGSFGNVYLAHAQKDETQLYAIKVFDDNEENKEMIKREVEYLKKLAHKNTLRIVDYIKAVQLKFIVMEYCDGDTLSNFPERYRDMFGIYPSAKLVKHFASEIAVGLNYIHSKGLAHRDLKPDNIMITFDKEKLEAIKKEYQIGSDPVTQNKDNLKIESEIESTIEVKKGTTFIKKNLEKIKKKKYFFYEEPLRSNRELFEKVMLQSTIKIIDFGLSKEASSSGNFTTICGNLETLCPEIVFASMAGKSETKYTNSVDLWSFAYILTYLSTGFFPFMHRETELEDVINTLSDHFKNGFYFIDLKNKNISYELIILINSILQIDPSSRIASEKLLLQPYFTDIDTEVTILDSSNINSAYLFNDELVKLNLTKRIVSKNSFLKEDLADVKHEPLKNYSVSISFLLAGYSVVGGYKINEVDGFECISYTDEESF